MAHSIVYTSFLIAFTINIPSGKIEIVSATAKPNILLH